MGYENSTVYKITCDDGCYYYGSTIQPLKERMWHHRASAKTMTSKLYTHINQLGWDKVQIAAVETPPCTSRKELRVAENTYILPGKDDPLCLNTLRSFTPEEEKRQMETARQARNAAHRKEVVHAYYESHKDAIAERHKRYYEENRETFAAKHRDYAENHKEEITLQRKQFYEANKERLCREKRDARARTHTTPTQGR